MGAENEPTKEQTRPGVNNTGRPLSFNAFEEILLEWSVATVGRSWSIIADILRNFPLTSGQQFDAIKIADQYFQLKARKGRYYHKSMKLEPIEDDKIPILGRFKPYLLMNRMLPVYPQQYMLQCDYLDKKNNKEEFKLRGKRRMREFKLPSEYEIRELKYKCTYDVNPLALLDKNLHQTSVGKISASLEVPSPQGIHSHNPLVSEGLVAKATIYQLAKILDKQIVSNPIHNRKEQLKKLFHCKMETVEVKAEPPSNYTDTPFTSKVNMNSLLENLFVFYQDMFKFNWNAMTNAWYQNHRSIALYTRKPPMEHDKNHQQIKTDHATPYSSSINYQKGKPGFSPQKVQNLRPPLPPSFSAQMSGGYAGRQAPLVSGSTPSVTPSTAAPMRPPNVQSRAATSANTTPKRKTKKKKTTKEAKNNEN